MLKFSFAIFVLTICSYTNLYGQGGSNLNNFGKMVDFLPPAPNAASIIKYGGININKNTGAPSVNIPLLTIKSKKSSTSVALSYGATGIRVDEIASRVGIGWTLQAGGVVTRTVRGTPDDVNTRIVPWAAPGENVSTFNFMNAIANSDNWTGYDSEPDLYSFNINGYSGSFVFDSLMNIVQINRSNIKIYKNFDTTAAWNFKIISPDGMIHYFGGTTATERTKRDQVCGKVFDVYIPTAWYIKSIVHPNGDSISFTYTAHEYTYDTGVSQTMHWSSGNQISGGTVGQLCATTVCSPSAMSTCISLCRTKGVLLDEIVSLNNSKIKFHYISRSDCGDKLVSKIELINTNDNSVVNRFDFVYNIVTANSTYNNEYRAGHNYTPFLTKIIEKSGDSSLSKPYFFHYVDPSNRAARLSFSQDHWGFFNGKINSYFIPPPEDKQNVPKFPFATANREMDFTYAVKGMLCKIVYPTGGLDSIVYEPNAFYTTRKESKHHYTCSVTGTGTQTQVVKRIPITTTENQTVEMVITCVDNSGTGNFDSLHNKGLVQFSGFSQFYYPNQSETVYKFKSSGTDTLKIYATGSVVTTQIVLKYYPSTNNQNYNREIAGIRTRAVFTSVPDQKPMIKEYYYGEMETKTVSSMYYANTNPVYQKDYDKWYWCPYNGLPQHLSCPSVSMHSNTLIGLNAYQSSPVSYQSVIEGIGEDLAAGATHSKFNVGHDSRGWILWGDDILEAPLNNRSTYVNGKPDEETVYKNSAGSFIPLQKTKYVYKTDDLIPVFGYTVNRALDMNYSFDTTGCSGCWGLITAMQIFSMYKYEVATHWTYADTVIQTMYNQNGLNPLVTTTKNYYEYSGYPDLLSKTETYNSQGELLKTENRYPANYAGTAVYDSMIAKNMISQIISVKSFNSGSEMSEVKTSFAHWGSNNYDPDTVKSSIKAGPLETEGTINARDSYGNILEYTGKDGIVNAIIWGYNYQYPVAKVAGATYSQATAELSVTVSALQSLDGSNLQTELNRIRTNLSSAYVTTYLYKHLIGVTSITDPNNKTNTYEYDAFNRLKVIKDQDGNVVKNIEYSYAQADSTVSTQLYFNSFASQAFTPQNCITGYVGNSDSYWVPAGKYYSTVSQAAADAKAQADITANGQKYVNAVSWCYNNTSNCTGNDKKLVNCLCETGVKVYTSSVLQQNGQYLCTYHYEWSDGSWSQNYTEYSSTCCYLCGGEEW